ncbi:MAG: pro-sigmaK processing inhibitor BofA family protein [Turicibacter sp.]|nr:pro-sigmaK processing inhibitor BofA family protein [Turicibacter sp.]
MKTIFWFIKKIAFGFVALYAFNFIGSFINIGVASNWLSYFIIGTLGVPGLLIVYIANVLLGFWL